MRFEKLLTTCLFALLVTIIHADLSTIASIGDDLYDNQTMSKGGGGGQHYLQIFNFNFFFPILKEQII